MKLAPLPLAILTSVLISTANAAPSATDYAELASHPDFTGFWLESRGGGGPPGGGAPGGAPGGLGGAGGQPPAAGPGGPGGAGGAANAGPAGGAGGPPGGGGPGGPGGGGAPLNAEATARLAQYSGNQDPGDISRYCTPFRFAGNNGSYTGFDVVYSPGRITLLNEEGLIRRIWMDREMPDFAIDSLGGTSVGHWEGDTLVVETAFIDPETKYPSAVIAGASSLGENIHMLEKFYLDGDLLKVDLEMTAPDLFTDVFKVTRSYRKEDASYWPIQRSACVENDRLVDPVTGKQRFDLTPPDDLPPPPSK